jgi:anaerobic magnesium-protoporphyrin IX monomethyl ester cyclase
MMFQGTYTSEFYRSVRDLLHAEVSLQASSAAQYAAEHSGLRQAIERRWQQLLSMEHQHRTAQRPEAPATRRSIRSGLPKAADPAQTRSHPT